MEEGLGRDEESVTRGAEFTGKIALGGRCEALGVGMNDSSISS